MDYQQAQQVVNEISGLVWTFQQPHVRMRPKCFKDGDKWCALLGDDIMTGIVAFGDTPEKALMNWDLVFLNGDAKPIKQF